MNGLLTIQILKNIIIYKAKNMKTINLEKIKNYIKLERINYNAYYKVVKGFKLTFGKKRIEYKRTNNKILNKTFIDLKIK